MIPLLLDDEAEVPFRLGSRQYIDFSDNFEKGLAGLTDHLIWLRSPAGELQSLKDRLTDAERDLPRAANEREGRRIETEMEELREQIEHKAAVVADPEAEKRRVQESIDARMKLERRPVEPTAGKTRTKFINPPPMVAPGYFQDRHVETGIVGDFLKAPGMRMITAVGRGGVGKTAMVCRLLHSLERGHLPDELGELSVDGIVYLGETGAHWVSADNMVEGLLKLLPPAQANGYQPLVTDASVAMADKMTALLEAFAGGRTVILLDNLETVIDAESRALNDSELNEALRTLLSALHHGVKVIVTTRVDPMALRLHQPQRQETLELDTGLASPHAERALKGLDRNGLFGLKELDETDPLLQRARVRTRGYPRALEALCAILSVDRTTTFQELLADGTPLPDDVVEVLVGEAFDRLDQTAQTVMMALAIFARPVGAVAVDYLLQPYRPGVDSAPVLNRLVNMNFVRHDRQQKRYALHQVDLAYALAQIEPGTAQDRAKPTGPELLASLQAILGEEKEIPAMLQSALPENVGNGDGLPFIRFALRDRAAEYFKQTCLPREQWRSLNDLEPVLAEFE